MPRRRRPGKRTPRAGRHAGHVWHFFSAVGPHGPTDVEADIQAAGEEVCAKAQLEMEHREAGIRDIRHDLVLKVGLRAIRFEQGDNGFWLVYGVHGRDLVVLLMVAAGLDSLPEGVVEVAERRWGQWRRQ
jgi:hypothetical protein